MVQRKTLLLTDDLEFFLQFRVPLTENHRLEIHTIRSGLEVLELAKRVQPDLVLIDITLPDMKGDIVCRILKSDARTRSIPVIILGSTQEKEASNRVLAAGADGLIFKPASRELLLSTIECYLGIKIRRHARAEVFLSGDFFLDERKMALIIHSLSIQGAFLEIDRGDVIAGDLIMLQFKLPGSQKEITVSNAAVMWLGNYKGDNGPWGVGVRFLDILPESSFLIALYLEHVRQGKEWGKQHDLAVSPI